MSLTPVERTCKACGWVHMGVSREFAQSEVDSFNTYFYSLSQEKQQENYGGKPATIQSYEFCRNCGSYYTNFRNFEPGDCPTGVTLNPIIYEN